MIYTFIKILEENNIERIKISKGTFILKEEETNEDIFFLLSGVLESVTKINDKYHPLFEIPEKRLVGLISAFEPEHRVLSSVRAKTDAVLIKISKEKDAQLDKTNNEYRQLIFLISLYEFRSRMKKLVQLEKTTCKMQHKLILQERLATVGRLSASLAHELNNNITVIQKGLEFLYQELPDIISPALSKIEKEVFLFSLNNGFQLPLHQIRQEAVERLKETASKKINRKIMATAIEIKNNNPRIQLQEILNLSEKELRRLYLIFNAGAKFKNLIHAGKQVTHVVQHFKMLSKPPSTMEMYNLSDSIKQTIQLYRERLKKIQVNYCFKFNDLIECRPEDLTQLWSNLISNALDAMGEKGSITFYTEQRDEAVIIRIEDSGPGIPKELGEVIFNPHITNKKDGFSNSLGLGLGLTICSQIVLTHKGAIKAIPKQGAGCIEVTLPVRRKKP